MGFLSLFKTDEHIKSLKSMILEYKTLLQQERESNKKILNDINNKIDKLILSNDNDNNNNNSINTDLTPLEQKIYNYYISHKPKSLKAMCKPLKLQMSSLVVYKSKLKAKGFILELD